MAEILVSLSALIAAGSDPIWYVRIEETLRNNPHNIAYTAVAVGFAIAMLAGAVHRSWRVLVSTAAGNTLFMIAPVAAFALTPSPIIRLLAVAWVVVSFGVMARETLRGDDR